MNATELSEAAQEKLLQKLGFCTPNAAYYLAKCNHHAQPDNLHQLRTKAKALFARNFRQLLAEKGFKIDDDDLNTTCDSQKPRNQPNPHFYAMVTFLQREPLMVQYERHDLCNRVRNYLRGTHLPRATFITNLSIALGCYETDLLPREMLNQLD